MKSVAYIVSALLAGAGLVMAQTNNAGGGGEREGAAPEPIMAAAQAPSALEWKDGTAQLGHVEVDSRNREVRVPGWVNMTEGAIELLACGRGGKTHESVFVLDVNPLDLQAGLLLLGLQPGTPPTGLGEGMPTGTEVDLRVEWEGDGRRHEAPAGAFVYNYETKSVMSNVSWVYTGSVIEDGMFKALAEESLIVTYWDPWAIINVGHPTGSNDEIWAVNRAIVPPLNTPITMHIKPRGKKEEQQHGRTGQSVHRAD
jgi:hypothetical protein